jgi:carbamoyl-phosphate synthase large subunit
VSGRLLDSIREQTEAMALELGVIGLINIQFAIKDRVVYVLEVNPRASRTVPFVSKAVGVPLAKLAAKVMLGATLQELGFTQERTLTHVAVKEAVLPFAKFPNVDSILGPEMKSTGEVMGMDSDFGLAFAKSQIAANGSLPTGGTVFLSVREKDKLAVAALATRLAALGFTLMATEGTAGAIGRAGVPVERVYKVTEGFRPHIVDRMKSGEVAMLVNTPEGRSARLDSYSIRRTAVTMGIPHFTTMAAAEAAAEAIAALRKQQLAIRSLQEYHAAV